MELGVGPPGEKPMKRKFAGIAIQIRSAGREGGSVSSFAHKTIESFSGKVDCQFHCVVYYGYMIHQNSKIAPVLLVGAVAGVFLFSLYVFLTTENTTIVVNEAAAEPKEEFVAAANPPAPEVIEESKANPKIRISETGVGFLNVRDGSSLQAQTVGRVKPGEVYEYTAVENNWYRIVHADLENAWVSGQYVQEVDRSSDLFGGE